MNNKINFLKSFFSTKGFLNDFEVIDHTESKSMLEVILKVDGFDLGIKIRAPLFAWEMLREGGYVATRKSSSRNN